MKIFKSKNLIKNNPKLYKSQDHQTSRKGDGQKIILIFLLLVIGYWLLVSWPVYAQENIGGKAIKFFSQIKIPGFEETEIKGGTLAKYISSFYKWSVTAVAILAVIMIMISGLQWIFAAGNPPAIAKAKDQMISAILGLILILLCIPLLKMINPALVRLSSFQISEIRRIEEESGVDLRLFLIPKANFTRDVLKVEEFQSGRHFCLGDFGYPGITDSGIMDYIGGSRSIVAIIFFKDNKKHEMVAIKGFWENLEDPGERLSICMNENGCGNGEDGWVFTIHNNLNQDQCDLVGFAAPCSAVIASKEDAIKWVGQRGVLGDPDVVSQKKGNFILKVTMFSRQQEFSEQTDWLGFTQTCGIGVEQECRGTGTKYCCKEKKETESGWQGYYYDFHCSLALPCDRRNENWEEQKDRKKEYCNID